MKANYAVPSHFWHGFSIDPLRGNFRVPIYDSQQKAFMSEGLDKNKYPDFMRTARLVAESVRSQDGSFLSIFRKDPLKHIQSPPHAPDERPNAEYLVDEGYERLILSNTKRGRVFISFSPDDTWEVPYKSELVFTPDDPAQGYTSIKETSQNLLIEHNQGSENEINLSQLFAPFSNQSLDGIPNNIWAKRVGTSMFSGVVEALNLRNASIKNDWVASSFYYMFSPQSPSSMRDFFNPRGVFNLVIEGDRENNNGRFRIEWTRKPKDKHSFGNKMDATIVMPFEERQLTDREIAFFKKL